MYKGSCLCGAVHYEIRGDVAYSSNCFCTMCQKQHGAASGPYVNVARADLVFTRGADAITRYTSSPGVARSSCTTRLRRSNPLGSNMACVLQTNLKSRPGRRRGGGRGGGAGGEGERRGGQ